MIEKIPLSETLIITGCVVSFIAFTLAAYHKHEETVMSKKPEEGEAKISTVDGCLTYENGFCNPNEAWSRLEELEEMGMVEENKYGVFVFVDGQWEIWED